MTISTLINGSTTISISISTWWPAWTNENRIMAETISALREGANTAIITCEQVLQAAGAFDDQKIGRRSSRDSPRVYVLHKASWRVARANFLHHQAR